MRATFPGENTPHYQEDRLVSIDPQDRDEMEMERAEARADARADVALERDVEEEEMERERLEQEDAAAAIEQGAATDTGTEPERDDDPLIRDKWQDRHGNPINLLASEGELLEYFRLPAWDTEDERTMWRREGVVASIERLGRARYSSVGEIVRRAGGALGGMRVRAVDGETVDVTTRTLAEMRDDAHTELDASLQASQPEAARDFAEVLERLHRLQPPPVEAAPEPELTEVWRAVDQAFREAGGPASPTGIADATVEILRAARADQ